MPNQCSPGALARLYVEPGIAPHVFDSNSESYEFLHESLIKHGTIIHPNGIRGTRSRAAERARLGPYYVMGTILFNIDPAMLVYWLPRMLGADAVGTTFDLAETLPAFGVLIDRVAQTFEMTDCYISRWIMRGHANGYGGQPEALQLALEIIGKTRDLGTAVPDVDISTAGNTSPYIFEDLTLTLDSLERPVLDFIFYGNNFLQPRFGNSLSAIAICPQDREIGLNMTVPFNVAETLNLIDLTIAGVTGEFKLTNATLSMTATLGNVKIPTIDPNVRGKQEIVLPLQMQVYSIGTTPELSINNDSTV